MANNYLIKILPLFILLFAGGCEKDELTKPVGVTLEVGFINTVDPRFTFTSCKLGIKQIAFKGRRVEGDDVFFYTRPDDAPGIVTISEKDSYISVESFDLPQGVYSFMEWEFMLKPVEHYFFTDYDDDDDDDDDDGVGMVLEGIYVNKLKEPINIKVGIDANELFVVNVKSEKSGYDDITLSADKKYRALWILEPAKAFFGISDDVMMDADLNDDFEETDDVFIEISNDENEDIYRDVLRALKNESTTVVIR